MDRRDTIMSQTAEITALSHRSVAALGAAIINVHMHEVYEASGPALTRAFCMTGICFHLHVLSAFDAQKKRSVCKEEVTVRAMRMSLLATPLQISLWLMRPDPRTLSAVRSCRPSPGMLRTHPLLCLLVLSSPPPPFKLPRFKIRAENGKTCLSESELFPRRGRKLLLMCHMFEHF